MIGHFLLTLTPEEEDRVLTRPMQAEGFSRWNKNERHVGCLVEVAWENANIYDCRLEPSHGAHSTDYWVPGVYDELCERFGEPRVNAAIRQRILANRASRTLRAQEVHV